MAEFYIPTDRVPPEILNRLKEIVHLYQSESDSSPRQTSSPSNIKKDDDECDNVPASGRNRNSVVHVLNADVTSREETRKDSSVVSLFGKQPFSHEDNLTNSRSGCEDLPHVEKESDVVSVLARRSLFPQGGGGGGGGGQNPRPSHPPSHAQHHPNPSPKSSLPPCSQSGQQYSSTLSYHHDVADHYSAPPLPSSASSFPLSSFPSCPSFSTTSSSSSSSRLSPRKAMYAAEAEDEQRRVVNNRSPCKTPLKHEDAVRQLHAPSPSSSCLSHSPSVSEMTSIMTQAAMTSLSSPSQSSRSRSPPSCPLLNEDEDDVVRVFPPRSVTPSAESEQKSPIKVLTPPETPENEVKRVVPEVFTFDDLTCTEERFRQTCERLHKLQDQFTPTKRSPSTPRHPPSGPSTPSYRFSDAVIRSPSLRRVSPSDPRLLQRMETSAASVAASSSPQSKLKYPEVPISPLPSTPQRLSVPEDYCSPQRRDSPLSPKPKKRLSFDDEGVPPHVLQAQQRMRGYEVNVPLPPSSSSSSSSYPPLPSPRPSGSGSGSENPFQFPGYPSVESQSYARVAPGTPKKQPLAVSEFQRMMMASLVGYQDEREAFQDERVTYQDERAMLGVGVGVGMEEEEGRGSGFFPGSRHVYEGVEFLGRTTLQTGRYTMKRKRAEPVDDGTDGMAMCTCAVMERNFLQMAECAYKRIRRVEATPADFDRFRSELAQTNDILRESMGLMKHIRDICDHRKRPRW